LAKLELIATAAFGLESVVAREIKNLGYQVDAVENGEITFVANELGICRANLWLRSAERVLVKMGEFPVTTFEELFQQTKALPWEECCHLTRNSRSKVNLSNQNCSVSLTVRRL
jgi:putative N6-adenine-specific DNA methylase